MVTKVVVIGAGIVGLSSAVAIQNLLPDVQVEIIADRFTRHTTSDGAGGMFVPVANGIPKALEERWAKDGASHYFKLANSAESSTSGVSFNSGFEFNLTGELPRWSKYVIDFHDAPIELTKHTLKFYKRAFMFTTPIIELPKYLPWLTDKFVAKGGRIIKKTVKSFEELSEDYDVIVNCAGLHGGKLANDPKIVPLRGQVLRVKAPWIKHFYHSEDHFYALPASETVAVGGTRQVGQTDLVPDPEDSEMIWKTMRERLPALEGAKVLWEWVGLRPYRDPVRVEAEYVPCNGKKLKVVHNYGHGPYGISMSWGTGVYTAELVQDMLRTKSRI